MGMGKLTWVNKYPTEPGFYWLRNYQIKTYHLAIAGPVVVRMWRNLTFSVWNSMGDDANFNKWDLVSAEWHGPIEAPE